MAFRRWLSSIQVKVAAIIFALTLALVGVLTTYFSSRQIAAARARLEEKAATYARLVSKETESGIAFQDRQTVREVFASVAQDGDVRALGLYEANNVPLYVSGEFSADIALPPPAVTELRVQRSRGHVVAIAPVVAREAGARGTLLIELSVARLEAERRHIAGAGALVGVGALVLGLLAAWAIGRSLAQRLGTLAKATHSVACGELDGVPLEDDSLDEVGQLTRGFATMQENLGLLMAHIRETAEFEKDRLDVLVRERTSELNASMERFRRLVESTSVVPWEMDGRTLNVTYVSPQAAQLYGYEMADLLASDVLLRTVHPDDIERLKAALLELGASVEARDLEIEFRLKTPKRGFVDIRAAISTSGSTGDQASVLRGFSFDVTSQRRLELDLRQAQKLESVGRLAAGVAHEINTPVQFVSDSIHFVREAMTDLIDVAEKYRVACEAALEGILIAEAAAMARRAEERADLPYLLENVPKALDRALEGLDRVTTIVRSMKEFAHPDSKEMSLADVNQAVRSTVVIATNEYKYVAEMELDLGDIPHVMCHLGDLNQVILNIIVNGAHAIGDVVKGTEERGKLVVRTRQLGEQIEIAISDSGGGIPADVQSRIFDPFFTTKEVGRGTGQGLAIARSVVCEKHQGELTFETTAGQGTTFLIRLPIDGKRSDAQAA